VAFLSNPAPSPTGFKNSLPKSSCLSESSLMK